MIKKIAFLSAAAASIAIALPAEAQWTSFTANNNGAEFWDNLSSDGTNCNIGKVVTGVAGNGAPGNACANQRPDPWLPFNVPGYDRYNLTQQFTYFGGSITIVATAGTGGDIAGQNRDWGYWTSTTLGGVKVNTNVNSGPLPLVANMTGLFWGFWVNTTDNVIRYSDSDNQFARFGRSTGCGGGAICGPLVVGIEDINMGLGGDRDYQDMIASISAANVDLFDTPTVPEPSTYALMAAGLAALGLVARRRRHA